MVRAVSWIDRLAWQAMRLSARNSGLAVEIDELKQLHRLSGRSPLRTMIEMPQRSFRGHGHQERMDASGQDQLLELMLSIEKHPCQ